jgi:hypothetical protein
MIGIFESDNGTKEKTKMEIQDISGDLPDQIRAELEGIWQQVKNTAIDLCPKDQGSLASTIDIVEGADVGSGISQTTLTGQEIANFSIVAGSDDIFNPKTGKPTSEYAILVHEGHIMRDGTFWEGVPFLTEALLMYEDELEAAVDRAMSEMGINTQG